TRAAVALRAVSREPARSRGLRPRRLRRQDADPPRRLPRLEDARGLRLGRAALGREAARPAPGTARLDRGARQRLLLRAARDRQDPPRDRARPQSLRARIPRRLRHRAGMGLPTRSRAGPQPARTGAAPARALPPPRRRRGRLSAARTTSRQL